MQVTEATFETEVLQADKPVLVDFWASWCPPCKMMEPLIDRLADELAAEAKTVKVNIDRNPQLAAEYKVNAVPDFLLFHNGQLVSRRSGALTENQLRSLIGQQ